MGRPGGLEESRPFTFYCWRCSLKVRLRFFALYREIAGRREMELELEPGVSVAHLRERLRQVFPRLGEYELVVAVNGKYVGPQDELREGDEVALLPPFSGG